MIKVDQNQTVVDKVVKTYAIESHISSNQY